MQKITEQFLFEFHLLYSLLQKVLLKSRQKIQQISQLFCTFQEPKNRKIYCLFTVRCARIEKLIHDVLIKLFFLLSFLQVKKNILCISIFFFFVKLCHGFEGKKQIQH